MSSGTNWLLIKNRNKILTFFTQKKLKLKLAKKKIIFITKTGHRDILRKKIMFLEKKILTKK